jgi:hypothetical protein
MSKSKLFQYAVIWHPTDKQSKEECLKSKVLIDVETVLAVDVNSITMKAAMAIPSEYKDQLDQIEIVVRPF